MTTRGTAPNRTPALSKGAVLELAFTDLLPNGQGVGRAEGMVVFSFGPLPGERARVRVIEVKQRYAVATALEVLSESPDRAVPFCPVFGACGGCQLQHVRYAAQLQWKRAVVREALARIGGLSGAHVDATVGMRDPRAYRNKISLVVDHGENPPAVGFYRQRSHDVVPIAACPVVRPALNAGLARLAQLRNEPAVTAMLHEARHLVARNAGDASVLTITTQRASDAAAAAAPFIARELPGLAGVTNSYDLANANAILGRRDRPLTGTPEVEETISGVRYRVSTASFFQVNVEMVERIFERLTPLLAEPGRIVDLYCGVGTFALFFAKHGWSVEGVEENPHAVREARANAGANGLDGLLRLTAGRVEQLVQTPALRPALERARVVFLDPPRKGSDEMTLGAIAAARVSAVWYLSCDPATLARDLKFLVAKGYRLGAVTPFDMFPQTGHVEALAVLEYA